MKHKLIAWKGQALLAHVSCQPAYRQHAKSRGIFSPSNKHVSQGWVALTGQHAKFQGIFSQCIKHVSQGWVSLTGQQALCLSSQLHVRWCGSGSRPALHLC